MTATDDRTTEAADLIPHPDWCRNIPAGRIPTAAPAEWNSPSNGEHRQLHARSRPRQALLLVVRGALVQTFERSPRDDHGILHWEPQVELVVEDREGATPR